MSKVIYNKYLQMAKVREREQKQFVDLITKNGSSLDQFSRTDAYLTHVISHNASGLKFTITVNPTDFTQFTYTYNKYSPDKKLDGIITLCNISNGILPGLSSVSDLLQLLEPCTPIDVRQLFF